MIYSLPKETELTIPILQEFLDKHARDVNDRYTRLKAAYESDHDILHQKAKPKYKPDNRIVVNFPKYITDTMNGFFIGIPIRVTSDDGKVAEYVEYLDRYNDQDDNNAELAKICSVFGRGYEMYYTDEESNLCITYLSPMDAFMVYDDSIVERPMFFVRRYLDKDGIERGSVADKYGVRYFIATGGLRWVEDWKPHYFGEVPATEYMENSERIGVFEPALSMVNAFNKALSEKANDVDYFADAYLKVLGAKLNDGDIQFIRDNRVVNFAGDEADKVTVEFMDKPSNDVSQENLLNRLERLIFQTCMVINSSDENFGTTSGIALRHRLQAMENLRITKERKFTSGMNRRYKILFGHPASKVPADAWLSLNYRFSANIPANLLEEAQIAAQMDGITSKETQLKVLSVVESPQNEKEKIQKEADEAQEQAIEKAAAFGFGEQGADGVNENE